jgi:uncharacterized protein
MLMEWTPGGISKDVEDQRDSSGGGGGGFGFGGLGIGGIIIVGLLSLIFRTNLFTLFSGSPSSAPVTHSAPDTARDQREQPQMQLISTILDNVQDVWTKTLPEEAHVAYRRAKLVVFRGAFPSACGTAKSAIGPFYCPEDEKVYLDLSFFDELKSRFGAPGEFAEAYVIAHEIGHHVQKLLGIEGKVRRLQQQDPSEQNPLSVRLELQADCFAGVWSKNTGPSIRINESDVQSALGAAAAVGDDRLQKMATGRVSPESFTHGSSAQRTAWFKQGFNAGDLSACNTFQRAR